MKSVSKEVATEIAKVNNGRFEHNGKVLKPVIKERDKLFHKAKLSGGDDEVLKQKFRDTRSNVKNSAEHAKGKLMEYLVDDLKCINANPKKAWEYIKILKDGFSDHHVKKNTMKFKDKSGVLAMSDADNTLSAAIFF